MFHQFRPVCPRLITAVGFALMGALTMSTDAATLLVPSQHSTISAAISAANDNDIIEVADGTYSGSGNRNLILSGTSKTLTIRSTGGSSLCTIDCGNAAQAFLFSSGNDSTVRGFTIVNGSATQGGLGGSMYVHASSPLIESCVFQSSSATLGGVGKGGAVMVLSSSTASFIGCTFVENEADLGGAAGINGSNAFFINCLFQRNSADSFGGAVHGFNDADVELINCTLGGNEVDESTGEGTAISSDDSVLAVTNCIAWHNIGPGGADTIYESPTPVADVNYSDIEGYTGSGTGNIDEDPLFISLADDNFRLQSLSPCRNEGDDASVPVDGNDIDGDSSTTEPTPDLDWDERIRYDDVDMGCYEYRCASDFTDDCLVDDADFDEFMDALHLYWTGDTAYAPCPPYFPPDLNHDRMVNADDIIAFIDGWGDCPSPCGEEELTYPGNPTLDDDTYWRQFGTPSDDLEVKLVATSGSDPGDFEAKATVGSRTYMLRAVTSGYESDHLHTEVDSGELDVDVVVSPTPAASPGALGSEDDMPPYGFDVEYNITNISASSVELPDFVIRGIQLDADVKGLGHSHGTHFVDPPSACTEENTYPAIRYAPVDVVLGTVSQDFGAPPTTFSFDVSVGVSLRYPVLQYQHEVAVSFCNNATPLDDNWKILVRNLVANGSSTRAEIPAGESWTYTLSVRFMIRDDANDEDPEHWIHTLNPYRHYFWKMYGNKAKYAQDLRPIWAASMADSCYLPSGTCDPESQRGYQRIYLCGEEHQVDQYGWDFMVCYLKNYLINIGQYERFVMWTPSGLYNTHTGDNYPPQMLSDMISELSSCIVNDTLPALALIPEGEIDMEDYLGNINMGYWWGHVDKYASAWDVELVDFEIDNDDHVEAAFLELDRAECLGASTIGMDSLRSMDVWDALPWMMQLWDKYPALKFAAEPHCCDILHLHMPFATDHSNLVANGVHHAPLLSDYLVPGRETWILLTEEAPTWGAGHAYLMVGWGLTPLTFSTCIYDNGDLCGHVKCAAAGSLELDWDATAPGSIPSPGSCSATNPFTELAYSCPDAAPGDCPDDMSPACCASACSSPPMPTSCVEEPPSLGCTVPDCP